VMIELLNAQGHLLVSSLVVAVQPKTGSSGQEQPFIQQLEQL
jgi:hypothetical protein